MACIYSKFLADTSQSKNYVNYRENVDIYVNLQCYDIYALQFFVLKKVALGTNGLLILEGKGFENFLKQQRHQRTSVHFFLKTLKIQDKIQCGMVIFLKLAHFCSNLLTDFLVADFLCTSRQSNIGYRENTIQYITKPYFQAYHCPFLSRTALSRLSLVFSLTQRCPRTTLRFDQRLPGRNEAKKI